jgi:FkbM family methyltransferase
MENSTYKSVGDTYKTKARFAQVDQEALILFKSLGYNPKIIYDVGASDGSWSKDIYEVLPDASFYLFEPLVDRVPAYKAIMAENLESHSAFHLNKCALGEENGERLINIFPNIVGSTALEIATEGLDITQVKVPLFTIDKAIQEFSLPKPNVIKIDTQGFELSILKGAMETLPTVDVLFLECWLYRAYGKNTPLLTEIADWLLAFNFRLWDVGDNYRDDKGVLTALDCIFVNSNSGITSSWYY